MHLRSNVIFIRSTIPLSNHYSHTVILKTPLISFHLLHYSNPRAGNFSKSDWGTHNLYILISTVDLNCKIVIGLTPDWHPNTSDDNPPHPTTHPRARFS